ncbi:MAG: hypothetical protein IPK08_11655 [Bacteroidetes bacterium]|nr:hypothetical protein [Bacteroidota bacterium]
MGPGLLIYQLQGSNIEWYQASATNVLLETGNTYSPFVNTTTNYFAVATTGGTGFGGQPDISIGTASTLQTGKFGIVFMLMYRPV